MRAPLEETIGDLFDVPGSGRFVLGTVVVETTVVGSFGRGRLESSTRWPTCTRPVPHSMQCPNVSLPLNALPQCFASLRLCPSRWALDCRCPSSMAAPLRLSSPRGRVLALARGVLLVCAKCCLGGRAVREKGGVRGVVGRRSSRCNRCAFGRRRVAHAARRLTLLQVLAVVVGSVANTVAQRTQCWGATGEAALGAKTHMIGRRRQAAWF